MKIVLIYPSYPETFWSFKYALKFISKKASYPPLGLITVAAMLPKDWEKKLIDLNVTKLKDKDLLGADFAFISAMTVQRESVKEIIGRCKKLGIKIVAGGPLFTAGHEEFENVDHFVLNEAEITLTRFLEDLNNGCAKHVYTDKEFPDIEKTPIPLMELVKMNKYDSMNLQYSRGCPFNCEFCDITNLFGRKVRTKSKNQVLDELENIRSLGWRGGVFFVDDNFIGNKKKLKIEILPAIIEWMEVKKHPFSFITEASIDISDDEELMQLMVKAGFISVFIGIETPHEESLVECKKQQNKNRDMVACVKKIHNSGLEVMGGFIVGFDNDPISIFEKQIEFIQRSNIVTAMVGLLNAPRGTKLYQRLKKENRLNESFTGDNTDMSINFIPKMKLETLTDGYKKILKSLYSHTHYYKRVKEFLRDYKPPKKKKLHFHFSDFKAFIKSIFRIGVIGQERVQYWKLFFWTLFTRPKLFKFAITFSITGFHFRKIFEKYW